MRDNALVRELLRQGHDAILLPLYLPLTLEEEAATPAVPIFFGGLNVYLQQRFPWFRHSPAWLDRWLDHPRLLKFLGRFSGMTQGGEIGALTLSMLQGEEGAQERELNKLLDWMRSEARPDAVWLSTGLMAGLARRIQSELNLPVLCSLQGEDSFLDGLPEPWRKRCWEEMESRCRELSSLVAPSRYFAEVMERRMNLVAGMIQAVPNGMSLEGFGVSLEGRSVPTIGYLARLSYGKGLGIVVDAFIELRKRKEVGIVRLCCVGTMIAADAPFLSELRAKLLAAGLENDAEFHPNVTKEEKVARLQGFSLLSVPAIYGEAFGLYLIEAMACGVPVVQPRTAAFTEIIESTEGGVLLDEISPDLLADAWQDLLLKPEKARALGEAGRRAVLRDYSMHRMAGHFLELTQNALLKRRASETME